jgi:transposase-like protein
MKKKRFSVEQIAAVLKQAELGVPVAEVIRKAGISEQTIYRWKKQLLWYGDGSGPSDENTPRGEQPVAAAYAEKIAHRILPNTLPYS